MEAGEIRFYRCGAAISRRRSGVPIERSSLGQALWSTSLASAIPNLSPVLHADVNSTCAPVCSRSRSHYCPNVPSYAELNHVIVASRGRTTIGSTCPDGASRRRVCIERAHVPRMFRCPRSLLLLAAHLISTALIASRAHCSPPPMAGFSRPHPRLLRSIHEEP